MTILEALSVVISAAVEGAAVVDLCKLGDQEINKSLESVYKSAKIEKGIAFPTCIGVNHCCGHLSALETDTQTLKSGDVVKMLKLLLHF
jgi:methionine aminopeptidase